MGNTKNNTSKCKVKSKNLKSKKLKIEHESDTTCKNNLDNSSKNLNDSKKSKSIDNSETNKFQEISLKYLKPETQIKSEPSMSEILKETENIECVPDILDNLDNETSDHEIPENYPNKLYMEHLNQVRACKAYVVCKKCNFYCPSMQTLEEHTQEKLNVNKVRHIKECIKCKFKSIWSPIFERHICIKKSNKKKNKTIITPMFRAVCYICNKNFTDINCCKGHLLKVHNKTHSDIERVIENVIENLYQCESCYKMFETLRLLKTHPCIKNNNVKCEMCNFCYCNQNALDQHKKDKHSGKRKYNILKSDELIKKQICQLPSTSKPKTDLIIGIPIIKYPTNLISFYCPKCDGKFTNRSDLKVHLLSHDDIKDKNVVFKKTKT